LRTRIPRVILGRVRLLLAALAALATASLPAAAAPPSVRVAFVHHGELVVLDLATHARHVVTRHAGAGPVAWSGDGRLASSGGRIAGGPSLPTGALAWAPAAERGAYTTRKGSVVVWTPRGSRRIVPDGWGATTVAWSQAGLLALGRSVCRVPCGVPTHREVWVWDGRSLRRVVSLPNGAGAPMPVTWTAGGRVVWWLWPDSGSIAADGVALYAGRRRIGETLMYPDYVVRCGRSLALADGGDRYATHGKRLLLGGRDVSHDRSRSWVSPSCSRDGAVLVAAVGRNWEEDRFGHEARAIWELRPVRKQLTHPPRGWTDEAPHVLADGSILFVRTRQTTAKARGRWVVTVRAELERLEGGRIAPLANLGYGTSDLEVGTTNYYGHYEWPRLIAVSPS
jgi:hypothetical protein